MFSTTGDELDAAYEELRLVQGQRLALESLHREIRGRLRGICELESSLLDKVDDLWRKRNAANVIAAMEEERARRLSSSSSSAANGTLESELESELVAKAARLRAKFDTELERQRRVEEGVPREEAELPHDLAEDVIRKANQMWAKRASLAEAERRIREENQASILAETEVVPEVKAELLAASSAMARRIRDETERADRIRRVEAADADERKAAAAAADAAAEAERNRRLAEHAKAEAQEELLRARAAAHAGAAEEEERVRRMEEEPGFDEWHAAAEAAGAGLVRQDAVSAANRRAAVRAYEAEAIQAKLSAVGQHSMATAVLEEIERTANQILALRQADTEQALRVAEDTSGPDMDDAAVVLREDVARAAAARRVKIEVQEERLRRLRELYDEETQGRKEAGRAAIAAMEEERAYRMAVDSKAEAHVELTRATAAAQADALMDAEQERRMAGTPPPVHARGLNAGPDAMGEELVRAASQASALRSMDRERARRLAEVEEKELQSRSRAASLAVSLAEAERQARVAHNLKTELVQEITRAAAQQDALDMLEEEQERRVYANSPRGQAAALASSPSFSRELARNVATRGEGTVLFADEVASSAARLTVAHAAEAERARRIAESVEAVEAAARERSEARESAAAARAAVQAEARAAADHAAVLEELERERARIRAVAAMEAARSERMAEHAHAAVQEELAASASRLQAYQAYKAGREEQALMSPRSHMARASEFGLSHDDLHSQVVRSANIRAVQAAADAERTSRATQMEQIEAQEREAAWARAARLAENERQYRIARDTRTALQEDLLRARAQSEALRAMEAERRARMVEADSIMPAPRSPRWYDRRESLERRANQFKAKRMVERERRQRASASTSASTYDFIDDPTLSLDAKIALMDEITRREKSRRRL